MFVTVFLTLVTGACAPAAQTTIPPIPTTAQTPATPGTPVSKPTPTVELPQKTAVPSADATPKYGGTLVLALTSDVTDFDTIVKTSDSYPTQSIVNEELWGGD